MRRSFLFFLLLAITTAAISQTNSVQLKNGSILYLSVGTERVGYTHSDIHFISEKGQPSFDFTLKKAGAHDEGGLEFISDAPQYSYNVGFYSMRKNFGIEFQFDHVKYIMRSNQTLRVKGTINGRNIDKDTLVSPDFVQFEHTDGANYSMLSYVKWKTLATSKNKKNVLNLLMKAGAGPLIPKTNSTIMGRHFDDEYAVSGYVIGLESGLRYNFLKFLFASASFKGAYANYTHFVIANGHGNQHWVSAQFNLMAGFQVSL